MKSLKRQDAIRELRDHLLSLVDDDHTICEVVATMGILCKGLSRLSDEELRQRFDWIARTRPGASRRKLEEAALRYKLARQEVLCVESTCDASVIDRDTCLGWDEFTDADLVRFFHDWFSQDVQIA
jgi:hypothetical protein